MHDLRAWLDERPRNRPQPMPTGVKSGIAAAAPADRRGATGGEIRIRSAEPPSPPADSREGKPMKLSPRHRNLPVLAALLAIGAHASPLAAQPAGAAFVRGICCACTDGSVKAASIATSSAPWRVTPTPGASTLVPVTDKNSNASHYGWTPLSPARWVGPAGWTNPAGDYTFELTVVVPDCTMGARMVIAGKFAADNKATLYYDNNQVAVSQGAPNLGFQAEGVTSFQIPAGAPGTHTIRIVVFNREAVAGLSLVGALTTHCPDHADINAADKATAGRGMAVLAPVTRPRPCACAEDPQA